VHAPADTPAWLPTEQSERTWIRARTRGAARSTVDLRSNCLSMTNAAGYIPVSMGAAGLIPNWPARYADLEKLSRVTDRKPFSAASHRNAFGPMTCSFSA